MEFYTVWAQNRIATEKDNREGPFTLSVAYKHLHTKEDCDCMVITFFNHEWHQIEYMDEDYFCRPLSDTTAYWDVFDYKEE